MKSLFAFAVTRFTSLPRYSENGQKIKMSTFNDMKAALKLLSIAKKKPKASLAPVT
jgi:hypothetical protein